MASASDVSDPNASFQTVSISSWRDTTCPGRVTSRPSTPTTRGGSGTSWSPRQSSWLDRSKTKGPKCVFTRTSGNLPRSFNRFQDSPPALRVSLARRQTMSLFATKSIEQIKKEQLGAGEHSLKRVLGPMDLLLLGVGAVIGTGIFVLTGQAAAAYAGPAIVISMVIAGLASALAGLCYAEFASAAPVAGSAYIYAYATLGEFIAWVIGWDLILEYALGAATVAVGWSGNLNALLSEFGLHFPPALSAAPGTIVPLAAGGTVTAVFNLPAVLITVAVTALLIVGIQESA